MLDCWIMVLRQIFAVFLGIGSLRMALSVFDDIFFGSSPAPSSAFFTVLFGAAAWLVWA